MGSPLIHNEPRDPKSLSLHLVRFLLHPHVYSIWSFFPPVPLECRDILYLIGSRISFFFFPPLWILTLILLQLRGAYA